MASESFYALDFPCDASCEGFLEIGVELNLLRNRYLSKKYHYMAKNQGNGTICLS
jgi:hypothetical protein